jgi:hypothetical protein
MYYTSTNHYFTPAATLNHTTSFHFELDSGSLSASESSAPSSAVRFKISKYMRIFRDLVLEGPFMTHFFIISIPVQHPQKNHWQSETYHNATFRLGMLIVCFKIRVRMDRRFGGGPRSLWTFWAGCSSGTAGTARTERDLCPGPPAKELPRKHALCSLQWSMRPHVVFARHMYPNLCRSV